MLPSAWVPQGPGPLVSLPHPTHTIITFGAPPPSASCEIIDEPDPILATDLVRGLMGFLCVFDFPFRLLCLGRVQPCHPCHLEI